ncbi:MAG: hypothetical protein M0Q37_08120 [Sphaerochaeta sp.]|nr:hypothetical protein [Sphaerochaeta sp.]
MDVQERIKRAQEVMKLSNREMASHLGIQEDEYLRQLDNPDREFYEALTGTFGISMTFLMEGSGPIFDWRPLPISSILAFRDERDWRQFHTPKDLAISITLEASELLECFQWSAGDLVVGEHKAAMEEELADILIYAVSFADAIGSDIPTIIREKLAKNGAKYPVEKAWGTAAKYSDFEKE